MNDSKFDRLRFGNLVIQAAMNLQVLRDLADNSDPQADGEQWGKAIAAGNDLTGVVKQLNDAMAAAGMITTVSTMSRAHESAVQFWQHRGCEK